MTATLSILRVVVGLHVAGHGAQKLLGWRALASRIELQRIGASLGLARP
jgi:hypothetical protein